MSVRQHKTKVPVGVAFVLLNNTQTYLYAANKWLNKEIASQTTF